MAERLAAGAQPLGRELGIEARDQRGGVGAEGSRAVGRYVERAREPRVDSLDSMQLGELQTVAGQVETRLSGLPNVGRMRERSAGLDAVGARRQRQRRQIHKLI